MGRIALHGVEIFAHIGVSAEERQIGRTFVVDIEVSYPLNKAGVSDDVLDTFNYEILSKAIHQEMKEPHKLLEKSCRAIAVKILEEAPGISDMMIRIQKKAPFIKGQVQASMVEWHYPEDY